MNIRFSIQKKRENEDLFLIQSHLSKTILCTEIPEIGSLIHKHMLMLPKFAYVVTFLVLKQFFCNISICLCIKKPNSGISVHKMVLLRWDCITKRYDFFFKKIYLQDLVKKNKEIHRTLWWTCVSKSFLFPRKSAKKNITPADSVQRNHSCVFPGMQVLHTNLWMLILKCVG